MLCAWMRYPGLHVMCAVEEAGEEVGGGWRRRLR